MKKNLVIIILVLIVLTLGGYIGYEQFIKKDSNEAKIETKEDKAKESTQKNENSSNNEKNNINITVNEKYDNNKIYKHSDSTLFSNIVFTNIYYYNNTADETGMYDLYNELYMNNTKIVAEHRAIFVKNLDEIQYYIEKYDKEFKISSFDDSVNNDKYILLNYFHSEDTCPYEEYILINKNETVLGEYSYTGNCGWSSLVFDTYEQAKNEISDVTVNQVEDKYYLFNEKSVYVTSNKIYSLENSDDCENIILNLYTVENGNVKKKLVKSYSTSSNIVSEGGQC